MYNITAIKDLYKEITMGTITLSEFVDIWYETKLATKKQYIFFLLYS